MMNIPTELLRTLVAVVELRSFTKAAHSLGVTQPAVSAQIKRLQLLLGSDLLDKSAPGVSLTPAGELVVNYARRLLSINDQILDLAAPHAAASVLRIGVVTDFITARIAQGLASFRVLRPHLRFLVTAGSAENLLRELSEGPVDLVVCLSQSEPVAGARHAWTEDMVWVRSPLFELPGAAPVPLVAHKEECSFTRESVKALNAAGRDSEVVLTGAGLAGMAAAVAAGVGISALPRNAATAPGVSIWENGPLPALPGAFCGIYVKPNGEATDRNLLADTLARTLQQGPGGGGVLARPAAKPR